jgi:glutathione synthase/RimK-type ligase-like ATP-grasp enzyme
MAAVVLATCADLPDGDEDAPALLSALDQLGVAARYQVWTDPAAKWDDALVVLRSTWDYAVRRAEFLSWARDVPRLMNALDVVEWNTDKTYLADLAAAGIPVVPTTVVPPGVVAELPGSGEYVVKPSVGAGSRGAGRFASERVDAARAHVAQLHASGHTVLVQPYLHDVDVLGERALVYIAGVFSHAVTKGAMLAPAAAHALSGADLYVEERIAPAAASADERAVGDAAVAYAAGRFGMPLYARVDLLPSDEGPVVVELELTEPSLFLGHCHGAVERFAAAIAARA